MNTAKWIGNRGIGCFRENIIFKVKLDKKIKYLKNWNINKTLNLKL